MIKTAPLGLEFIVFVAVFLIVHLLRLIGEYSIIQILIYKSLRKALRMFIYVHFGLVLITLSE